MSSITEIDITPLVTRHGFDPYNLSNSRANLGENAGKITWENSRHEASGCILLESEGQREAFRDFVKGCGAWSAEEIAAWNETELNALLIQWIAGDIREGFGDDLPEKFWRWDWAKYRQQSESGRISGRLYLIETPIGRSNRKSRQIYFCVGT